MIDTIVAGVDGSEGSVHALHWAEAFAPNAKIQPVAVWDFPHTALLETSVGYDPTIYADAVEANLSDSMGDLGDQVLPAKILSGRPGRLLLKESLVADLLVVGSRGHGLIKDLLLGSVSQYCASHAEVPVVVVPKDATLASAGDVVVGVDGSDNSRAAIRWALQNIAEGANVELVNAWQPIGANSAEATAILLPLKQAESQELVDETLSEFADLATERDIKLSGESHCGDARRILKKKSESCDLLILGARGTGPIEHLLVGSVTSALVNKPHIATVIVRLDDK